MAIGPNFISHDGNRVYRLGRHELQPIVSFPTERHERTEAKYGCGLAVLLATEGLEIVDTIGRRLGTARTWAQLVTFMQEAAQ